MMIAYSCIAYSYTVDVYAHIAYPYCIFAYRVGCIYIFAYSFFKYHISQIAYRIFRIPIIHLGIWHILYSQIHFVFAYSHNRIFPFSDIAQTHSFIWNIEYSFLSYSIIAYRISDIHILHIRIRHIAYRIFAESQSSIFEYSNCLRNRIIVNAHSMFVYRIFLYCIYACRTFHNC